MATTPATKPERKLENKGAGIERRAMRGIITSEVRRGNLTNDQANILRERIDKHIETIGKRPGGLGRK